MVVDRDAEKGEQTSSSLRGQGYDAGFVYADVSNEEDVAAMADVIEARHGRVEVVVNNAGIAMREGSVETLTRKHWDLTIAVNLTSVYLVSKYLLPLMGPGSTIVNVSTAGSLRAVPGTDAYLAAKGGVIALTKAMAVSLADRGVRVNVVCPGVILTHEVASRQDDPRVQKMASRASDPLGRGYAQPEEFASVVRFLCSEDASYVNGAVIPVEGGSLA